MFIEPVARFRSPFKTKFGIPRQAGLVSGLRGRIVFEPSFRCADAVRGLEGFDYVWLIWGFSGNRPRPVTELVEVTKNTQALLPVTELVEVTELAEVAGNGQSLRQAQRPGQAERPAEPFRATVRPPRLGGNERIGVFASRSPFRPNGLGLSSVRIESIEYDGRDSDGKPLGPVINVLGADLMDGTPIYDIKPYVTYTDSHPEAASGFVDEREWKPLKVEFSVPFPVASVAEPVEAPDEANTIKRTAGALVGESGIDPGASTGSATDKAPDEASGWTESDIEALKEVLAQDPRPRYQNDPDKEYGMIFNNADIRFKVKDGILTVIGVKPAPKE